MAKEPKVDIKSFDKSYRRLYKCTNCLFQSSLHVEFGSVAKGSELCPYCGTTKLDPDKDTNG